MTRRDWWLGVGAVVATILLHAFVPRYEWRNIGAAPVVRIDRWTGQAIRGTFEAGRWTPPQAPLAIVHSEPLPPAQVTSAPLPPSGR